MSDSDTSASIDTSSSSNYIPDDRDFSTDDDTEAGLFKPSLSPVKNSEENRLHWQAVEQDTIIKNKALAKFWVQINEAKGVQAPSISESEGSTTHVSDTSTDDSVASYSVPQLPHPLIPKNCQQQPSDEDRRVFPQERPIDNDLLSLVRDQSEQLEEQRVASYSVPQLPHPLIPKNCQQQPSDEDRRVFPQERPIDNDLLSLVRDQSEQLEEQPRIKSKGTCPKCKKFYKTHLPRHVQRCRRKTPLKQTTGLHPKICPVKGCLVVTKYMNKHLRTKPHGLKPRTDAMRRACHEAQRVSPHPKTVDEESSDDNSIEDITSTFDDNVIPTGGKLRPILCTQTCIHKLPRFSFLD